MKSNILLFLILLSGTYTTVLCVRNQEEPPASSSSSSDSSDSVGGRKVDDSTDPQNGKGSQELQQLESKGPKADLKGQVNQQQQQSNHVPDTESETKVEGPPKGPDLGLPKVEGELKPPGPPDDPLKNTKVQLEQSTVDLSSPLQTPVGAGVKPPEVPKNTEDSQGSGHSPPKPNTQEGDSALAAKAPGLKTPETPEQKPKEEPTSTQLPQPPQLPSTKTDQTINPLSPLPVQPPLVKNPEVPLPPAKLPETNLPEAPPAKPPVTTPLESRTKEVVIKPVVNPTSKPKPETAKPGTDATPQVNAQDTPPTEPNDTQENVDSDKDNQVKEVLLASLKEMQTNFESVNSTELVQPPADKIEAAKKSLCESFKTDLVNVCTPSGQNASSDLFTFVNNYYRNNVCMTEHSLNQLFNKNGDFAYKLLTTHLSQFSKKAPNKSTQDVYDKSVPVVTKLVDLMKDAELALVSDTVKSLLEKRNLILTSVLCAVANADRNVMASTQFESGQVTLTVNQEDYIKETTEAFMKAYAPMAELLKQFNTLVPKLLDIFEAGFENKINMLTSLANSRKTPEQPGVNAPVVSASGSARGNSSTTTSGAGSGSGPSPPLTSNTATAPLPGAQATGGLPRQPASPLLKTEATKTAPVSAPVTTGTTVDTGSASGKPTLLEFLGEDNREVAAVHGHPSLIQKFKSLLQVSSTPGTTPSPEPTPVSPLSPKEQSTTTAKDPVPGKPTADQPGSEKTTQGQGSENGAPGADAAVPEQPSRGSSPSGEAGKQGVKGPQVDVNRLNGMEVLARTTTGGVVATDHSQHQLATSGSSSVPAKPALDAATRAELDAQFTGTGPLGLLSQIKMKLKSFVSKGNSGAQEPGKPASPSEEAVKKQIDVEKEQQLFDEAIKHFMHLGMFKTSGGRLVAELDEQKVKALVRANLLTLNDFDSLYNLVVGPQRSLHSLYVFMEHMLLSPDADEKIKHLEDSKLLERIKKMVNPLEDLYEQIKANVPRLTLRRPVLGPDSEVEATVKPSGEAAAEHVNKRGKFLLVSNSSGVSLSDHNLLIKIKKLIQNLSTRSGFKVGERDS